MEPKLTFEDFAQIALISPDEARKLFDLIEMSVPDEYRGEVIIAAGRLLEGGYRAVHLPVILGLLPHTRTWGTEAQENRQP